MKKINNNDDNDDKNKTKQVIIMEIKIMKRKIR